MSLFAIGDLHLHFQSELKAQGHTMTFMELRLLAAELQDIRWSAPEPPPAPAEKTAEPPADAPADQTEQPPADAPAAGKTTVEMNRVVRPGAAAEGTVSFGSGASATWVIDQFGRLGLEKVVGEYTDTDIREFQQELARLFGR